MTRYQPWVGRWVAVWYGIIAAVLLAFMPLMSTVPVAAQMAVTYYVGSTGDASSAGAAACGTNSASNGCTLREALALVSAGSSGNAYTILFAIPAGSIIGLTSAQLGIIGHNVTIAGPVGGTITVARTVGNSTPFFRVLYAEGIYSGNTVVLSNLTIAGGRDGSDYRYGGYYHAGGGGLYCDEHCGMTLTDVTVRDNNGGDGTNQDGTPANFCTMGGALNDGGWGGGIANHGGMVLRNTTVYNNAAGDGCNVDSDYLTAGVGGNGGGIYSTGSLSLINSTVTNNRTGFGGSYAATVPGNGTGSPGGDGGGIFILGEYSHTSFNFQNTTIAYNTTSAGGGGEAGGGAGEVGRGGGIGGPKQGLVGSPGDITIGGTIVSGNGQNEDLYVNTGGTGTQTIYNDQGYNLIGRLNGYAFTAGTNISTTSPRLDALQDNGGPTKTRLPLADSDALDKIPVGSHCPATDQRGVARPQGGLCDIGAAERGAAPLTLAPSSLPNGIVSAPYSQQLTASGGTGTGYTYVRTSGSLPLGLSLNSGAGVISGTPTTGGTSTFTITVTDSGGTMTNRSYTITVAVPNAKPAPKPNGTPIMGVPPVMPITRPVATPVIGQPVPMPQPPPRP